MGEQIKGEDWLPEGWKVEIRVRKSGKKDRYYTDPVNGYIFRSLKDIDRYLLSGKLGKHVTKNKPKSDLDNDDSPKFDFIQHISVPPLPKKKKSIKSNVAKKVCQTAVQGQKKAKDESKKENSGAENLKETVKKTDSRSSKGGRAPRPKKKRESTPFFILDPEQCEDSSLSIPNLSDIIDSMLKEKEGSKTVYLSAPAIGSLLGEKLSENRTNNNNNNSNKKPKFAANKYKGSSVTNSNKLPCVPTEDVLKKDDSPYNQEPSHTVEKSSIIMVAESKAKDEPAECLQFEDLFDDPCIDFAIKTLTGTSAYGA